VEASIQLGMPAAVFTNQQSLLDQPVVVAALIAACGGILVNFLGSLFLQFQRFKFDKAIAIQRLNAEISLSREKQSLDQRFELWKAKRTFAEDSLAGFYEAEKLFHFFRSAMSFRSEAESRQGREDEPEALRNSRDTYWPVLKRMDDNIELFNNLHARRFRAMALFGPEADEPFVEIRRLHARVHTAGQALMNQQTHSGYGIAPEFKENMERVVWEGLQEPDQLAAEIAAAVAKAEAVFGPILSAREP
jgi:hypothetical protein